jgi:hypothetical protein
MILSCVIGEKTLVHNPRRMGAGQKEGGNPTQAGFLPLFCRPGDKIREEREGTFSPLSKNPHATEGFRGGLRVGCIRSPSPHCAIAERRKRK